MKRIASHLCTLLVGMVAVAGHFMLTQWLFGQTVAIIYLGFQLIIAAWIVYELIRALDISLGRWICIIQIVSSNDQM